MTFSRHSFLLKTDIVITIILFAGIAAISGKILPFYPELVQNAVSRTVSVLAFEQPPAPYAAYVTILVSVFYALTSLILLFYFFEKTQSVEAHFFLFFIFSFVAEILRAALPLRALFVLPSIFLSVSAHGLVFFRFFGIFSLFCAALFSSGLKIDKEENILFPMIIITMFISFRLPVNTYTWDTTLCLVNGYPLTFKVLEAVISTLTVLSFICGAIKRAVKEYYWVAAGALLVLLGRTLLFGADTYLLPVAGIAFLSTGTYLIGVYLRRIYLWI